MVSTNELIVVDVDSHVAEPEDLWTSRLPVSARERAPHVEWDADAGERRWKVGDILLSSVGEYCTAGWPEPFPSHPPTLEEADPACWDPKARLRRLDEEGIAAQVLYPNIIAFDTHAFYDGLGSELALECVRAYNDYITDFASADPDRLIPITMLPFWDVDASVKEMQRASAMGHRGVLMAALLGEIGLKNLHDEVWEPLLGAAQELELPINLHVGISSRKKEASEKGWGKLTKTALEERTNRRAFITNSAASRSNLVRAIAEVVLYNIPHRFPKLKFVSVESGFGFLPYTLEHLDWYWGSSGANLEFPDRELPSEYWRRQFFATFWFESASSALIGEFQDNLMFETDFPHETSLQANGKKAVQVAQARSEELEQSVACKVLSGNAKSLYKLDNVP